MLRIPKCINLGIVWFSLLLSPSLLLSQRIPVAVLDFDAFGISKVEAAALSNRLRNELFNLGKFSVVERGMMDDVLREQDFQQSGCTSNECLVEVGMLLGAELMIGGSISKVGETFTVSARLVDVASGKLLKVSDFDLVGKIDNMLTRGMGEVAAMLSMIEKQPMTESTDTTSLVVMEPREIDNNANGSPVKIDPGPIATTQEAEDSAPESQLSPARMNLPLYKFTFGMPLQAESGQIIELTRYARTLFAMSIFSLTPAITVGRVTMNDNYDVEKENVYFLTNIQARVHVRRLRISATLGYGYGTGEIFDLLENTRQKRSGYIVEYGSELTYNFGKINLLVGIGDLHWALAMESVILHIGLAF